MAFSNMFDEISDDNQHCITAASKLLCFKIALSNFFPPWQMTLCKLFEEMKQNIKTDINVFEIQGHNICI